MRRTTFSIVTFCRIHPTIYTYLFKHSLYIRPLVWLSRPSVHIYIFFFFQVSYFHFIMLCMLNNNTSTSCSVSITQSFAFVAVHCVVVAFHFVAGCCDFYTPPPTPLPVLTEIGVILFHLIKMFSA